MAGNNPEALMTLLYILKERGQHGDGLPVAKIADRFNEISPAEPLMGLKLRRVLRFAADSGLLRSQRGIYHENNYNSSMNAGINVFDSIMNFSGGSFEELEQAASGVYLLSLKIIKISL